MTLKKTFLMVVGVFTLTLVMVLSQGCSESESPVESVVTEVVNHDNESNLLSADNINVLGQKAHEEWLSQGGKNKLSLKATGMCIQLSVPFYSQRDNNWKNTILGHSKTSTIGDYGCHLTCVSMLYAKWGYSNMNPTQLNNWAKSNNGFYGDLLRAENAVDYGRNRNVRNISGSQIYGELRAGHPVVVRTTSGGSHFMIIYGFDGYRFWVKDPWVSDWRYQNKPLYGNAHSDKPFRVYGY